MSSRLGGVVVSHRWKHIFLVYGYTVNKPFLSLCLCLALRHGDISRGGTSATQQKKFHADDVNQYLHNISGSHGVPHPNFFNFTFLVVDFTKVLCSSVNELQQNSNASSREEYILPILTVLLEIHRVNIRPSWPFVFCLSFVNNSSGFVQSWKVLEF